MANELRIVRFTRVIAYPKRRLNYCCNVSIEVILTTCLTHRARMHFARAHSVY